MNLAKQAQISPQIYVGIQTPILEHKIEGRGVSDANSTIPRNPSICITLHSLEEAIRFYRMGYIPTAQFEEMALALKPAKEGKKWKKQVEAQKVSRAIQYAIQAYFGTPIAALQVRTRRQKIVFPRQLSIWMHCKFTNMNLYDIAELYYQDRDHTNAIHAREKINSYLYSKWDCQEKDIINDF